MDVPEASQRFGLLLEAYLRGSVNHIPELRKQMDGMGKLRSISELLHSKVFKDRVSFLFHHACVVAQPSVCCIFLCVFVYGCCLSWIFFLSENSLHNYITTLTSPLSDQECPCVKVPP